MGDRPIQIPLVDLTAQYASIKPEIDAAIQRVIDGTSFIGGEEVFNFERAFAASVAAKSAVGVASGTAALQLALKAIGVGPGDEVITTARTFVGTAEATSQPGARPVHPRSKASRLAKGIGAVGCDELLLRNTHPSLRDILMW